MAKGRLIAGFGAGYVEAELAALGVGLSERGRRMDEYLDAIRELWVSPRPEYHGQFVDFAGIDAQPRPVQPSGPPIVLGGVSAPARRRTITKANGWYVFNVDRDLAREAVEVITADQSRYDRPAELGSLEITITPKGRLSREMLEWYEQLGVDRLVILPHTEASLEQRDAPAAMDDILRTIERATSL